MQPAKSTLLFIVSIISYANVIAQKNNTGRTPVYAVAYECPNADSVKVILNRVKHYYENSSAQKIIDIETGNTITDLTKLNKSARVSKGLSSEWTYTNGVVLSAFTYITGLTGDSSYFANNTKFYDFVLQSLPYFRRNAAAFGKEAGGWPAILEMDALDDCGSIGAALIKTCLKTKDKKYLELINSIADYISSKQFRLKDGTLARHRPQYQSLWADDMYMSVPFLANMGVLTGNKKYFDDAVKQVLQMANRLYIPQKELFDHGWSVTSGQYDPRFYWGRANGWILMSMVELLGVLPHQYPGREQILHLYRSTIRTLAGLQDGTGFWHNLLDRYDTYLETSCTAMFSFAIAKGINEGWISHVYGPVALTAWNAVTTRVLSNGAVEGTCEATTFAHDNVYYYNRGKSIYATHGYGPVLYAGAEMLHLLQNKSLQIQKPKPDAVNSTFHFILKSEWPDK